MLLQRWPHDSHYISGSNELLRTYGHSKLSKMAASRQLGFDVIENSAIRSADPENLALEPNMKCIGSPVAEIWPAIRVSWGHMEPPFWGKGGHRGSAMAPFERVMVVSYRLSIVTLHNPIQSAICDRMSVTLKSKGGWAKISACSPWTPDVCACGTS